MVTGAYGTINSIGLGEACKRALEAGADVLLMPSDVPTAIDAVVAGIQEGRFTTARVDSSVRRILADEGATRLESQSVRESRLGAGNCRRFEQSQRRAARGRAVDHAREGFAASRAVRTGQRRCAESSCDYDGVAQRSRCRASLFSPSCVADSGAACGCERNM